MSINSKKTENQKNFILYRVSISLYRYLFLNYKKNNKINVKNYFE